METGRINYRQTLAVTGSVGHDAWIGETRWNMRVSKLDLPVELFVGAWDGGRICRKALARPSELCVLRPFHVRHAAGM